MKSYNSGNAFFGLSFILFAASCIAYANTLLAPRPINITPTEGIHSMEEFEILYEQNTAPFHQLSEEAAKTFAMGLKFSNDGTLLYGSSLEIDQYIPENEQQLVWDLLFGKKVILIGQHKNKSTHQKQYTSIEDDNSSILVVKDDSHFYIQLGV